MCCVCNARKVNQIYNQAESGHWLIMALTDRQSYGGYYIGDSWHLICQYRPLRLAKAHQSEINPKGFT